MRWLKHMTATRQDEKIAAYLDSCEFKDRHAAYGFYWTLLEIVASGMDKDSEKCSATYSLTSWSRLLYCHHHTVSKYLGKLEVTHLVTLRKSGGNTDVTPKKNESNIEVLIPTLLKYRDEYSKKSRMTPDNVRPKIEIEIENTDRETNTDTETTTPCALAPVVISIDDANAKSSFLSKAAQKAFLLEIRWSGVDKATDEQISAIMALKQSDMEDDDNPKSLCMLNAQLWWFDEFWKAYWNTASKKQARTTFCKVVTTADLHDKIMAAIVAQSPQMNARPPDKIPHASTWLNGARWDDPTGVKPVSDQEARLWQ